MPNKNNSSSSQKTSSKASTSRQAGQSSRNTSSNNASSSNTGSSNTGFTMPQTQQSQHTTVQPAGQHQQGHAQGHVGGQYGQPAATQPAQTGLGGNALQSATSAQGQQAQNLQQYRWRNQYAPGNAPAQTGFGGNALQSATSAPGHQAQYSQPLGWPNPTTPGNPPGNNQGATGQASSSSTSAPGRGAGAYGSTMATDVFRPYGGPPNRGTRGPGSSRGRRR